MVSQSIGVKCWVNQRRGLKMAAFLDIFESPLM